MDSGEYNIKVVGPHALDYATIPYENETTVLQKLASYGRLRPALNFSSILRATDTVDPATVDVIFLDSSVLGHLIPSLRKRFPAAYVVTFFHNVEFASYRTIMNWRSPLAWIRMASIFKAEQVAAKDSDLRIALSSTDSESLGRFFGTSADMVWPISYPAGDRSPHAPVLDEEYVLFVGAYYKPNLDAIEYLARSIAPHVSKKIVVAGFNLDRIKAKYAESKTLIVVDSPANLAPLYQHANLVLAPIFSGGGIKTKIIEALSFGKFVVASSAAAMGFERISRDSLAIATGDADYIDMINSSQRSFMRPEIIFEFDKYFSARAKSIALREMTQRLSRRRGNGLVA